MNAFCLQNDIDSPGSEENVYMPAQAAAEYSGYSLQYLRRLLNSGVVAGIRIGQVWLVKIASLDAYIQGVQHKDRRYGPRVFHEYMAEKADDRANP